MVDPIGHCPPRYENAVAIEMAEKILQRNQQRSIRKIDLVEDICCPDDLVGSAKWPQRRIEHIPLEKLHGRISLSVPSNGGPHKFHLSATLGECGVRNEAIKQSEQAVPPARS